MMDNIQRAQSRRKITAGLANRAILWCFGLTTMFSNSSFMLPVPEISAGLFINERREITHRFDNHGFLQFPKLADYDTPSNPSYLITDLSCTNSAVHSSDQCNYCLDFQHESTGDLRLLQVKLTRDVFNAPKGCKVQIENAGNLIIEAGAFYGAQNVVYLKITNNNIKYLGEPQAVFTGLTDLRILNLSNNNILKWDTDNEQSTNGDTHKTLGNLKILILDGNPLNHISNQSLLWLQNSSITHLSFRNCGVASFENGFLHPIADKLRVLELGAISTFNAGLYGVLDHLDKLKGLGLANMGITSIPTTVLENISSTLQYLSLHGNLIHSISSREDYRRHPFATNRKQRKSASFPYMESLEEIDLRSCSIYFIEAYAFDTLPKLKVVLLARNLLIHFNCFNSFYVNRELVHLDLSHNPLELQKINVTKFPALESLDLSYTQVNKISFHAMNITQNLKRISINYAALRVIQREDLQNVSSLEILELAGNTLLGKNLNGNVFCDLIDLKELNLAGCSFVPNPDIFSCLKSLRKLNLMSNGIMFLSNTMLKNLPLLESLNVNDNMIQTWNKPVFSFNSNLKHLSLAHNHLTYLSEAMFSDFYKLKALDVSINPFICDCYVLKFVQFVHSGSQNIYNFTQLFSHQNQLILLQKTFEVSQLNSSVNVFTETVDRIEHLDYQHLNGQIVIEDWNKKGAYICSFVHDASNEDFNIITYNFRDMPQNICQLNKDDDNGHDNYSEDNEIQENSNKINEILVYGTVMIVTVSASVSVGIIYWKWQYVKYYTILVKNSNIFRLMSTDKSDNASCFEKIYSYDVFVSYSDQNRDWILKELLPNLESKTEISVCLHERDFQVGTGIVENIVTNMDVSRCILLVISQQFLCSQWCQFELQLAQYRLLEAKRQELILVFLEEIPKHIRPKSLTYLMKTKTYILWPESGREGERKCFWSRLNRAIVQYSVLNSRVKCMSVV